MSDDEPDDFAPDWDAVTPTDEEFRRIGHALRKINEIDGIAVDRDAEVELSLKDKTEATITIHATDAVIEDE